jgi:Uma2 family endonuclease
MTPGVRDNGSMSSERYPVPVGMPAPWAEIVRGVEPMTVAEFAKMPDDEWQYELVDGVLVRMPLSGGEASSIAVRLLSRLAVYVEDHGLGVVTGADGGFVIDPIRRPDTELGPDVAFVQASRVPPRTSPEYARAWPLAPDLAVEVASPSQYRPEMTEKVLQYLAAGTRLVWLVWPRYRQVDVWRSGDTKPSATLQSGEILDGEDVVPGFSYPVAKLFS